MVTVDEVTKVLEKVVDPEIGLPITGDAVVVDRDRHQSIECYLSGIISQLHSVRRFSRGYSA